MSRKTFSDYQKTLDNDIRTIIHKGRNTACFKFPFFQTILEFANNNISHVTREELSKPHVEKIIKHMNKSLFQGQTGVRNGKFLRGVKNFIEKDIDLEELLLITEKEAFKYVIKAFPIVGSEKITDDLYIDEMQTNKRIILHDDFLRLAQDQNLVNLLDAGADSRWDLQQRVWEKKVHPETLIHFDGNNNTFYENRLNKRVNLTPAKPSLTNYQGDVCFYCRYPFSLDDLEVDHFIPLDLAKEFNLHKGIEFPYNLNNIGNLVNSCKECNGPNGKWHLRFPEKKYWYELHGRNEQMCNSEKPLEMTIVSNLGNNKDERFQKLSFLRDQCIELHMLEWEGPIEMNEPLHYYKDV